MFLSDSCDICKSCGLCKQCNVHKCSPDAVSSPTASRVGSPWEIVDEEVPEEFMSFTTSLTVPTADARAILTEPPALPVQPPPIWKIPDFDEDEKPFVNKGDLLAGSDDIFMAPELGSRCLGAGLAEDVNEVQYFGPAATSKSLYFIAWESLWRVWENLKIIFLLLNQKAKRT
jgi:hypothetical protein